MITESQKEQIQQLEQEVIAPLNEHMSKREEDETIPEKEVCEEVRKINPDTNSLGSRG